MTNMVIFINGTVIPKKTIDDWEWKRIKKQAHFLKRKGILTDDRFLSTQDLDHTRSELGRAKASYSPDRFRKLLKKRYTLGNLVSKIAVSLSMGKRKFCVTEFVIPQTKVTPAEMMESIEKIMLENTADHLYKNLVSNPDHFVLIQTQGKVQEIIEFTGGSPLPTRFFGHYGKVEGLKSKLSNGYSVQLAGEAQLADGTVIGGMRHQAKTEDDGIRVKALVEFPALLPNYMIKQHQYHLACEFRQWIRYVLSDQKVGTHYTKLKS